MKETICNKAIELGFDLVGVAPASIDIMHEQALGAWVAKGQAAGMDYMVRDWARRAQPSRVLPGAQSIIALATNYFQEPNSPPQDKGPVGRVARYAYGKDYHKVIGKRLKGLTRWLEEKFSAAQFKSYVDTGPVLERAATEAAGLGFTGKNTTLISEKFGSWIFLSVILTDLALPPDVRDTGDCGSCTICLEACPTGAIVEPYVIDSQRCISYWTIESRDAEIPTDIARASGDWIFGCDICQEVCPYNHAAKPTQHQELQAASGVGAWIPLSELNSGFVIPAGSPLKRAGAKGLARNARAIARDSRS